MMVILNEKDLDAMEAEPFVVSYSGVTDMEGKYSKDDYDTVGDLIEEIVRGNFNEVEKEGFSDSCPGQIVVYDLSDIRDGIIHKHSAEGDLEEVTFSSNYPYVGSLMVPYITKFCEEDITSGFEFENAVEYWNKY